MNHLLTDKEAREAFEKNKKANLSKAEQEEFQSKIEQVARDMGLRVKKCEMDSLPDFVETSTTRLYANEVDKAPQPSPKTPKKKATTEEEDKDVARHFFRDVYQVTSNDGSSFYVMHNGIGGRMVSDNWTKESIDKCAEMAAKLGGNFSMIPRGEPGAFPDHLRKYAEEAYAKHGLTLADPTPPTSEQIEASKQKYENLESSQTQKIMKKELLGLRQEKGTELSKGPDKEQSYNNNTTMTPFSMEPKPIK
ncbi:hypothetical protein [Legionella cardiaca]|uniref:Substrate of the Dot/Icm secretion system n=1 Tax=Legionella cardiaca TaxID=1071983 RepID=A0ABY8ASY3_9GAMM|nr:hypothetical protein [Legionella cardiaca]WED43770.1 hypothetical protein PXX05_03040 [Legionella cardiaca]